MPNYVIVFAENVVNKNFILVEKKKPDWQRGKLNLVGGKIELNENPAEAASRELKEETGIAAFDLEHMGEIHCYNNEICYCYKAYVPNIEIKSGDDEEEEFFWTNWDNVKNKSNLMLNLTLIIPLCMANVNNWVLDYSENEFPHQETFKFLLKRPQENFDYEREIYARMK